MPDLSDVEAKANEAERLRTDPVFQEAVFNARRTALDALVHVDPSDLAAVTAAQAKVKAIDALTTEIANMILRGNPQTGTDRA